MTIATLQSCIGRSPEQQAVSQEEDLLDSFDDDLGTVLDTSVQTQLRAWVKLPRGRVPIQVYTRQLTERAAEEQIVISRNPERGNLELFLISTGVVSSVEGSIAAPRIVAQKELEIDSETFIVQTQDIIGDGRHQEIFVTGEENDSGRQHVYVYQLFLSDRESNVAGLRQIFYQSGFGSYEISYTGTSYNIVHQRLLDRVNYQLELTYFRWVESLRSFKVSKVEVIDNSKKLSDRLEAVYSGNSDDFLAAIDGLWLRKGEIDSRLPKPETETVVNQVFLYFDSRTKEMLVDTGVIGLERADQVIEVYSIVNALKNLWNRLNLNVRNKYVYNIQNYFHLTLEDSDSIRLSSSGEVLDYLGTYKRVNTQNFRDYQQQNLMSLQAVNFELEGVFTERSEGEKYHFESDQLTLSKADGKTWQGSYSLFSWRSRNYLGLHLYELNSYEEYRRTYRVEPGVGDNTGAEAGIFSNNADDGLKADTSVLLLYPVKLMQVEEVNNTAEGALRLEMEQKIDNNELESLIPSS